MIDGGTHVSDNHPRLSSSLPPLGDLGEGSLGLAGDGNRVDLAILVVRGSDEGVLAASNVSACGPHGWSEVR